MQKEKIGTIVKKFIRKQKLMSMQTRKKKKQEIGENES